MSREEDEAWRYLIERAFDDRTKRDGKPRSVAGRPRSVADRVREPAKITLPRLKFMEKPFDEKET